jgi:hypothetical protein
MSGTMARGRLFGKDGSTVILLVGAFDIVVDASDAAHRFGVQQKTLEEYVRRDLAT